MSRSQPRLMNSQNHNLIGVYSGIIFLILLYMLPWLTNPGVGLSVNAYDLAEWTTLHPRSANQPPPMETAILLRVPLLILAWMSAQVLIIGSPRQIRWWLGVGFTGVLCVALMPPIEFFTSEPDNANFQQQFMLFLASIAGLFLSISGIIRRFRYSIALLLSLSAAGIGFWGMMRARDLMIGFSLPVDVAPAAIIFPLLCIVFGLWQKKSQHKVGSF
jgi:hypothetical protein